MVHMTDAEGADICQAKVIGLSDIGPCAFFSVSTSLQRNGDSHDMAEVRFVLHMYVSLGIDCHCYSTPNNRRTLQLHVPRQDNGDLRVMISMQTTA